MSAVIHRSASLPCAYVAVMAAYCFCFTGRDGNMLHMLRQPEQEGTCRVCGTQPNSVVGTEGRYGTAQKKARQAQSSTCHLRLEAWCHQVHVHAQRPLLYGSDARRARQHGTGTQTHETSHAHGCGRLGDYRAHRQHLFWMDGSARIATNARAGPSIHLSTSRHRYEQLIFQGFPAQNAGGFRFHQHGCQLQS